MQRGTRQRGSGSGGYPGPKVCEHPAGLGEGRGEISVSSPDMLPRFPRRLRRDLHPVFHSSLVASHSISPLSIIERIPAIARSIHQVMEHRGEASSQTHGNSPAGAELTRVKNEVFQASARMCQCDSSWLLFGHVMKCCQVTRTPAWPDSVC